MKIYTVECNFSNSENENDWNYFYNLNKLPALISVKGFATSQRFIAEKSSYPTYLAIHSIVHDGVLDSDEYRLKGGGNFGKWQSYIIDWYRNIYSSEVRAPEVKKDEYLLMTTEGQAILEELNLLVYPLKDGALDKAPRCRWMAVASQSQYQQLIPDLPEAIFVYRPMTEQLTCI